MDIMSGGYHSSMSSGEFWPDGGVNCGPNYWQERGGFTHTRRIVIESLEDLMRHYEEVGGRGLTERLNACQENR